MNLTVSVSASSVKCSDNNMKRIDAKTPRKEPSNEPRNHQLWPRSYEEEWSHLSSYPTSRAVLTQDTRRQKVGNFCSVICSNL